MVEKLKTVVGELKATGKPLWLFAALKYDDWLDKWSIIIAAPWYNEKNEDVEYRNILNVINKNVTDKESSSLARVAVLPKTDHLVVALLQKRTGDVLKEEKVNGTLVYEGYIIESNPDLVWQSEGELFTKK